MRTGYSLARRTRYLATPLGGEPEWAWVEPELWPDDSLLVVARDDDFAHGLGTDDNPIFEGMHEASSLICGGSLLAAREIAEGRADRAVPLAIAAFGLLLVGASGAVAALA